MTLNAAYLCDERNAETRPLTFVALDGVHNVAPRCLPVNNEKRHCLRSYPVRDGYRPA